MLLKIYWSDKIIFLCNNISETIQLSDTNRCEILEISNATDIESFVKQLSNIQSGCYAFVHKEFDFLKANFFNQFHTIEAAGGVVLNQKNELLFIFRRGKWDLPKGKLEVGESAEICAEREIEEETGVNQLTLINKITNTYHIYEERGLTLLKTSHWFYFTTTFDGNTEPQTEEDISEIKWFSKNEYYEIPILNTFDAIKDVIDNFIQVQSF